MQDGFKLYQEFYEAPFPTGIASTTTYGPDLVLIDTFACGCIETYYGRFGNLKQLDPEKVSILTKCESDLKLLAPKLSGYALEYFQKLSIIINIVLSEIRKQSAA